MPSRRRFLGALGTATVGVLAGCRTGHTTVGTVRRKRVTVTVAQQTGDPVETAVASLGFEPEKALVHGEYVPEHLGSAVDGGTMTVSERLHEDLSNTFSAVRYSVNVVPSDGSTPANGMVDHGEFNTLSLGGSATVVADTTDASRLDVRETEPPETDPSTVTVSEFDIDERTDE